MDDFNGQVLSGARSSTSNADTTGDVSSGVSRAVSTTAAPFYVPGTVTDVQGARYRTTLLESGTTTEYLLWAHTSGPLAVAPGTVSTNGTVAIPTGTLTVNDSSVPTSGVRTDGTQRVVITDNGGAGIATVVGMVYVRGGTTTKIPFTTPDFTFDAVSGTVKLNDTVTVRTAVNVPVSAPVAVSVSRGDTFTSVTYTVEGARFNWTRNDPTGTRFGWNAAHRKWEPFKGGAVKNLGKLSSSASVTYRLNPVPTTAVGLYLPGSDTVGQYAMLRFGADPGESSYPVVKRTSGAFSGVLVVTDDLANANYNFGSTSPALAGVIGHSSGKVVWNPSFVQAHEGEVLWYSQREFQASSRGVVGSVLSSTLYLAPVPGPLERPILRFGNRAPLTVLTADSETALALLTVNPGEVGFALSTGKVKLNAADVLRANPGTRLVPNLSFDPLYLGASLRYDGVALNRYPQPLTAPAILVDAGGSPVTYNAGADIFIPDALGLPTPTVGGTGTSGIVLVPDGTGNVPDPALPVKPRPVASGLVQRLTPGFGDAYLFTVDGRLPNISTVNWDSELPGLIDLFSLPMDTAYVSLQTGKVVFGYSLAQALDGKDIYFSQSLFTPSMYPYGTRVYSRTRDEFTFDGSEVFEFRVNAVSYTWNASLLGAGTFTAAAVAASLATVGVTTGVTSGYVYIAGTTSVVVGFNETGCRALGFPPGWVVSLPATGDHSATDPNWLPDTGLSFGLSRSPNNLDGSQGYPDVRATYRVTDATLSEDLSAVPYQLLNYPPREDIAGYNTGEFFALSGLSSPTSVQVWATLKPYTDVIYQFEQSRFGWLSPLTLSGQVQSPVSSIDLGRGGIVPEMFLSAMGGYLRLSAMGGASQYLEINEDFLVPEGSSAAYLIDRIGPEILTGSRGQITLGGNVLTDTSVSFTGTPSAQAGDRLKIVTGNAMGSYTVQSATAHTLTVAPVFPSGSSVNVSWELYRGVAPGTIDPATLADAVYQDFNHLPSEPFEVRILTSLGTAGGTISPLDLPTAMSGRSLTARFGQSGSGIPLTVLTSTVLGAITNGPPALVVPASPARLSTGSFSLVVGTKTYVNTGDLIPVAVFSSDPGANIEYLTTTGGLKFGSTVRSQYQLATVVYREEVLPYANIATGTGELSPFTGDVALSASDIAANTGATVYVADLQTYDDVYLNPILGSFTFRRPLEAGQLVEATYFRAVPDSGALYLDSKGQPVQVTEFLPVYVRREAAARITSQLYSFNPSSKTVDTDVDPAVLVGPNLVSYGFPKGVTVTFSNNTLSLVKSVPDSSTKVLISYAVYEAAGGETSYTVSQGPVWRPPFQLEAGKNTFDLDTNRTAEMVPGKILRIGNYLSYIRTAVYNATTDITTVGVYPTPAKSVGTLAPSEPPTNLVTDRPITPVVDPAGTSPTPVSGADTGFLAKLTDAYGLAAVPQFQTVTKGQSTIRFDGDLIRYAIAGHVIELFGVPYIIAKSDLVEGSYTVIYLGSPSQREMVWTSGMATGYVRISVRPVYPEGSAVFIGAGGFLEAEPYDVVLFDSTLPGVTLVSGRDYNLDTAAGTLTLLQPRQPGLQPNHSLRFYRTAQNNLAPFVYQGTVQYPRLSASAGHIDPPSETNGRLGAVLQATYTFDSPDSFYARSLPLPAYISETSRSLVQGVARSARGNNPSVGNYPKNSPSTQGSAGLVSERQDLVNRDRVTRTFLRYYNGVITSFEQVLENINGLPVGDRDGKLRMWMGRDNPWTPPGYEDGITGAVNPRNVWSEIWNGYRTSPLALIANDPVINPLTATTDLNGNPVGSALNSGALGMLQALQYRAIKNDVDDVVLTGITRTTLSFTGFIRFKVTSYGVYRGLSEPSAFSRLYPERTNAFTTTDPGIGYDPATGATGVYSYGKLELDLFGSPPSIDIQSTTGKPIARLENPVRGNVTNVLGAVVSDRRARARILSYSPTGYDGVTTQPSFLATVLPIDEFPLLPDGTPDTAKLYSNNLGGTLYDLKTGDPSLHTPPFAPDDQLSFGKPDGTTYGLGYAAIPFTLPDGTNIYLGVFVDAVLQGCVVTLKTFNTTTGVSVPLTDPTRVVRLTSANTGVVFAAEQGDTLFVVPTTGRNIPSVSNPPTTAELGTYARSLPTYRMGTDVDLNGRTGELVDATLPSFSDPNIFGLKEIFGQKPPLPVTNLQAQVTFQNGDTTPSNIPALRGESRLDSGDYSLPYYGLTPTELAVLGEVLPTGIEIISRDTVDPVVGNPPLAGYPAYAVEAAYPDEILDNAGVISVTDPAYPAALLTTEDLNPGTLLYPSPGHSGVGDLQPYDLLFVQEGTGSGTLPAGSTGIITAGRVFNGATRFIEPPRFIAHTKLGDRVSLSVLNLQTHFDPTYTTGMQIKQDNLTPGVFYTIFTLVGVIDADFDNGAGGGILPTPIGGYNTLFVDGDVNTSVTLKILDPSTGNFNTGANVILDLTATAPTITACTFDVSGNNGATVTAATSYFLTSQWVVRTLSPFFDFTPYTTVVVPGIIETLNPQNYTIDVNTDNSLCYVIESDRLTVTGPIDIRSALPRGATTPGGDLAECQLKTLGGDITVYDTLTALFVNVMSTVNNPGTVNGGSEFSFLARTSVTPSTHGVGSFNTASPNGAGKLKVMAFEGWKNSPIASTDITFSAAPSARQDITGPIFAGRGISDRVDNPPSALSYGDNRFVGIDLTAPYKGSVANVLPGDILVVKSSSENPVAFGAIASGKAGTYLVRGAITANVTPEEHQDTYTARDTGTGYNGWLPFEFPTVTAVTIGATVDLHVSNVAALPIVKDWAGSTVTQSHIFPSTGTVFVIANESGLNSITAPVYETAIYSADYASLNTVTNTFVNLTNFKDGLGNAVTAAVFQSAASAGRKVTGMNILPVNATGPGVPENLPGYTFVVIPVGPPTPLCVFGFRAASVTRNATTITWTATSTGDLLNSAIGGSTTYVYQKKKQSAATFLPFEAPVYDEIPGAFDIGSLTAAEWNSIHTPTGAPFTPLGSHCFLPGDLWSVDYSGAAGIYVEPSFPRAGNDLAASRVNVVDATNSLTSTEIGFHRLADYLSVTPAFNSAFIEWSQFEVRRPRRFHAIVNDFAERFLPLRYSYEIRRGIVDTVVASGGYTVLTAEPVDTSVPPVPSVTGSATQLGSFANKLVNVNPGDEVRFIDASGEVYARAEVVRVTGALTLTLSPRVTVTAGDRFEVYLRVPPVPHEQSNEELLGYATDKVVLTRTADYTAQTGGQVPATNELRDTDTSVNYVTDKVQAGDIVLVDPAGTLRGPAGYASPVQYGRRPYGDNSVFGRGAAYSAGSPAKADDNRGYYKVSAGGVATDHLTVEAIGNLAGNNGADVILGTGTHAYAVYPTINASVITGGTEGQMDLRETRFVGTGNSYTTNFYSVAPFSYRVIRPSKLLSEETLELILAMRERMLSWMEEIRTIRFKYGTYFVFQRDRHITDLGLTTDPESGLGFMRNAYFEGVLGQWNVAPFANVRDCLSILDRRFWCLDYRLDTLTPPYGSVTPYADFAHNEGRPVLVDRIDEALDGRDKLRHTRYSWLTLRTDRVRGTLESIRRFDAELPKREAEAEQALAIVESVEKVQP